MKQLLFCPGPINTSLNVKMAVIEHEIGHREPEFSAVLKSVNQKLLALYGQKNDAKYYPIVITGSGTAANECMLSSLPEDKSVLVLANGEFGERLYDIAQIHNKKTYLLSFPWGEKINLAEVEAFIRSKHIDILVMVHHETSTGMLNPIYKVGKLAKKYKKYFIVDSVSSAGSEIIDIEGCNITFCSGSSSKAIGSFPGLSYVVGKRAEFEKLAEVPIKIMYLNLYKFYFFSKNLLQTPNTPAVQLFYGLNQALENILKLGLEKRIAKIYSRAQKMRSRIEKMGLKFLLAKEDMCNFLTTVMAPSNIELEKLKLDLKKKNIVVYDGKGPFKGKVFQVGHGGEFTHLEIEYCLNSLQELILKVRVEKTQWHPRAHHA